MNKNLYEFYDAAFALELSEGSSCCPCHSISSTDDHCTIKTHSHKQAFVFIFSDESFCSCIILLANVDELRRVFRQLADCI